MITYRFLSAAFFIAACSSVVAESAVPSGESKISYPAYDSIEASVRRGTIAFEHYCSLCHGMTAEGNGRAAKLYNPRPYNLRKSMMPDAYKEQIIRKGGKAMGRSEFMPPWGEELTNEQVLDIVNFLRTIAPPEAAK